MLTLQLRELEEDGLINRNVYAQVPPKVEYSLTEFGKTLQPILFLMRDWGRQYADTIVEYKASANKPLPVQTNEHPPVLADKAG